MTCSTYLLTCQMAFLLSEQKCGKRDMTSHNMTSCFSNCGPVTWNTLHDITDTGTSENDSRVYFMIVLTTDYFWRSWTCRIVAPYKFHVDWLMTTTCHQGKEQRCLLWRRTCRRCQWDVKWLGQRQGWQESPARWTSPTRQSLEYHTSPSHNTYDRSQMPVVAKTLYGSVSEQFLNGTSAHYRPSLSVKLPSPQALST